MQLLQSGQAEAAQLFSLIISAPVKLWPNITDVGVISL